MNYCSNCGARMVMGISHECIYPGASLNVIATVALESGFILYLLSDGSTRWTR